MAEPWPAALPQIPMLPVMMGFADGVIETQNDVGPRQTRRVTTAMPDPLRFRLVLTYAQLQTFHTFWLAVHGRALPFTFYSPLTKANTDMKFTAQPEFLALGAGLWEVALECEILP